MTQFEIPAYMPSLLLHFLMQCHGNNVVNKNKDFANLYIIAIMSVACNKYASSHQIFRYYFLSYHNSFNGLKVFIYFQL